MAMAAGKAALAVLLAVVVAVAEDEGGPCTHQRLGVAGTCVYMEKCPSAIAEREQDINPQVCGFRPGSLMPNVCCPRADGSSPDGDVTQREPDGGLARRKCQEYTQVARRQGYCFKKDSGIHGLIVNGVPAEPKEFPHMALLGYNSKDNPVYSCGGSLISEQWILTAAHCLSHPTYGFVKFVLLGDLDRDSSTDDARPQLVDVDPNVVRHPEFDVSRRYHDIALLRLQRPATLSEYVRPACLHYKKSPIRVDPGVVANVSGWGVIEFATEDLSSMLLRAPLTITTQAECNNKYQTVTRQPGSKLPQGIKDTQICAGSANAADACQGDSGGPLQVLDKANCMQHVVGVVSMGIACATKAPGVYTRVANYVPWIERTVWSAASQSASQSRPQPQKQQPQRPGQSPPRQGQQGQQGYKPPAQLTLSKPPRPQRPGTIWHG